MDKVTMDETLAGLRGEVLETLALFADDPPSSHRLTMAEGSLPHFAILSLARDGYLTIAPLAAPGADVDAWAGTHSTTVTVANVRHLHLWIKGTDKVPHIDILSPAPPHTHVTANGTYPVPAS